MRKVIIIILMAICFYGTTLAQHNIYGVKESLAPLCEKVEYNKYSPNATSLCDDLLREAKKENDITAMCFAMATKVEVNYNKDRAEQFLIAADEAQAFARKHHKLKYYYDVAFLRIKMLSIQNKELAAFQLSNEYLQKARDDKYAYGRSVILQTFAETKYIHGEFNSAIPYFKEALKYATDNIHEPDMQTDNINMQLGRCYLYTNRYEMAEPYLLAGLRNTKSKIVEFEATALLAQVAFCTNDKERFFTYYHKMETADGGLKVRFSRYGTRAQIYYHLLTGNKEEAYRLCMAQDNDRVRDAFLNDYYEYLKDYKNSFETTKKMHSTYSYGSSLTRRKDVADFVSRQENEILSMESDKLALEHNQLTLRNTNLELENASLQLAKAKAEEATRGAKAKASQLLLNKRNAEYNKMKLESERKYQLEEDAHARRRFFNILLFIGFFALVPIIIMMAYTIYRHHAMAKSLHTKQEELTTALAHAKEADILKEKYITNVGRGLGPHLSALEALINKLSSDDVMSDEDMEKLTTDIQNSSFSIIEVLDKTE